MLDMRKYKGLDLSPGFVRLSVEEPEALKRMCNGVGSCVGWLGRLTYHLIPNTVWFLDITPASDVHDVDYCYPQHFNSMAAAQAHRQAADRRFARNCCRLIKRAGGPCCLKLARYRRVRKYYFALRNFGEDSFLEGKTIGN